MTEDYGVVVSVSAPQPVDPDFTLLASHDKNFMVFKDLPLGIQQES